MLILNPPDPDLEPLGCSLEEALHPPEEADSLYAEALRPPEEAHGLY